MECSPTRRQVCDDPAFHLFTQSLSTEPRSSTIHPPYSATARKKMSSSQINCTTNSHNNNNTQYSHNTNAFNNTDSFNNNIVNIGVSDERSKILAWLSPLEPRTRHQDVQTRRADNVGEWLLQTGEFRRWRDGAQDEGSDHQTLFCCGGPGVGKTYLRCDNLL